MRRRRKNDKRVLKPRYNSPPQNIKRRGMSKPRKPRKTSRSTLLFIILILVAFVIGAGIGVSLALGGDDTNSTNGTHVKNVTVEMTNNLSKERPEFDYERDYIDYNNASDLEQYNITKRNDLNY